MREHLKTNPPSLDPDKLDLASFALRERLPDGPIEIQDLLKIAGSPERVQRILDLIAESHSEASRVALEFEAIFQELKKQGIDNPKTTNLLGYESELHKKSFAIIEDSIKESPAPEALWSLIPSERRVEIAKQIISKVKAETTLFEKTRDLGLYDRLNEIVSGRPIGGGVRFVSPSSKKGQEMLKSGTRGTFHSILNKIEVLGLPPSVDEIVLSLAAKGALPDRFSTLRHELTHRAQYDPLPAAVSVLGDMPLIPALLVATLSHNLVRERNEIPGLIAASFAVSFSLSIIAGLARKHIHQGILLTELHAREETRSSASISTTVDFLGGSVTAAAEVALDRSYRVSPDKFGAAIQAYRDIRSLRLLGLSALQVARVIRNARYDAQSDSYPALGKTIKDEASKWGADTDASRKALLDALHARDFVEIGAQQAIAKKIAYSTIAGEAVSRSKRPQP